MDRAWADTLYWAGSGGLPAMGRFLAGECQQPACPWLKHRPCFSLEPPGRPQPTRAGAQQSRYLPHAPCRALARAAGASARPWARTCSSSAPSASACAATTRAHQGSRHALPGQHPRWAPSPQNPPPHTHSLSQVDLTSHFQPQAPLPAPGHPSCTRAAPADHSHA